MLIEAVTGLGRLEQALNADRPLLDTERVSLAAMLQRRVMREPVQHIVGTAPFYGLELVVSAAVLIPRPETERLVELVLEHLPTGAVTVLDVGTGSGAVALAIKAERRDAEVWATDVEPDALAVAQTNAKSLGLDVEFRISDLLADAEVAAVAARCTALVANLPYLPDDDGAGLQPEVRHDPPKALFGGPDGLDVVERLRAQAGTLLPHGALLALELDPRNASRLHSRMHGWSAARTEADLTGRERFVLAWR
jgi:release factor glutamine methyltransferase